MGEYSSILLATKEETDSAKRLSDIVNSMVVIHPLDVLTHSWIAVRLSDGGYDGTLYDSRADAVRHQYHESECAYIQLTAALGGMPIQEAHAYLKFHRGAYSSGMKLTDPERPNGGMDVQIPLTYEDVRTQIRRFHVRRKAR